MSKPAQRKSLVVHCELSMHAHIMHACRTSGAFQLQPCQPMSVGQLTDMEQVENIALPVEVVNGPVASLGGALQRSNRNSSMWTVSEL